MKNRKSKIIYLLFSIVLLFLTPFTIVLTANYVVENYTKDKTFVNAATIQKNKVGLVLGTTKILSNRRLNLYFKYRINAAVELYEAGKIDFILVSGDNGSKDYDEPTDFKNALIEKGIPENKIFLDYAGFRTLDSVVRAKEIFGQKSVTIISQEFHNKRAIYLAETNGLKAIGFNAEDVFGKRGAKVQMREYLARTKVFVDMLLGVEPMFLGEKVEIK